MSKDLLPKKGIADYRIWLFVFYQIILVFTIIVAAIATYTAVKSEIIGTADEDLFSSVYRDLSGCGSVLKRDFIEQLADRTMTAGVAAFSWAIVVVMAAMWYKLFFLVKADSTDMNTIKKNNVPLLITIIVLFAVSIAIFVYQTVDIAAIHNFHYSWGDKPYPSYASVLDSNIGKQYDVSFDNIWKCTLAADVFAGLMFASFIPAIAFSAKVYNNWRISA